MVKCFIHSQPPLHTASVANWTVYLIQLCFIKIRTLIQKLWSHLYIFLWFVPAQKHNWLLDSCLRQTTLNIHSEARFDCTFVFIAFKSQLDSS